MTHVTLGVMENNPAGCGKETIKRICGSQVLGGVGRTLLGKGVGA